MVVKASEMPEAEKSGEEITKNDQKKKKRKNRSQLGPNFVPPDGGWGWIVAIAAGFSNLCALPVLQQFGLLFRERLQSLEISSSQITTIINLNQCLTSCIGLANGPLFRRFTYRQVAFGAALVIVTGLILTSIANSFITYVITFSVLYGLGTGVSMSSNALALNTYFREKRRMATSFSWTVTALGPIVLPHLITYTLQEYGVQGSVLIFAGIACHTFATASIFQPAQWHSRKPKGDQENLLKETQKEPNEECEYCKNRQKKIRSGFPYIYNSDDPNVTGYEILDPGTPMLALSNDGWYSGSGMRSAYGSKWSLTSQKTGKLDVESKKTSAKTSTQNLVLSSRSSYVNLGQLNEGPPGRRDRRPTKPRIEEVEVEDCPSWKAPQDLSELEKSTLPTTPRNYLQLPSYEEAKYIRDNYSLRSLKYPDGDRRRKSNTFSVEKEVLREASRRLEMYLNDGRRKSGAPEKCTCEKGIKTPNNSLHDEPMSSKEEEDEDIDEKKFTLLQKIVIFFDLDLLKDFTYVNLMVGITVANFAEINFSILTPFILGDFGYSKKETALLMSLLAGMDIGVRFIIPFVAGRIGWENKTFFLFGVMGMALGRVVLAHFQTFWVVVAVFCCIGLGKGLRTVFMALVIPSYIPLDRLPAATGLQLLFAGIFYFVVGPLVGLIRDATDFPTTLHCLNVATYLTAVSWGFEKFLQWRKEKLKNREIESDN